MELKSREGLHIAGKIKINTYKAGMVDLAAPLLEQIKLYRHLLQAETSDNQKDYFRTTIDGLKRSVEAIKAAYFLRTAIETKNLVMDSPGFGLDLIIQRLVGINTYSLNLAWIELGTGTATPTVNDTGLATPAVRIALSFQEDFGATDAIVQAFITDANLPNATYSEVGSFVDGTSTIGTGQIFNHALISPAYSKVSGQDTTIEIDFSIMNS
jgi:hypothetical protein